MLTSSVACPPSLFGFVLLRQSIPSRLYVSAPSSGRLLSNPLTTLVEPDVARNRVPQRSWLACFHVHLATTLSVGCYCCYKKTAGSCLETRRRWFTLEKKIDWNLALVLVEAFLIFSAKIGQCFITTWVLFDATFAMATSHRSAEFYEPGLRSGR